MSKRKKTNLKKDNKFYQTTSSIFQDGAGKKLRLFVISTNQKIKTRNYKSVITKRNLRLLGITFTIMIIAYHIIPYYIF